MTHAARGCAAAIVLLWLLVRGFAPLQAQPQDPEPLFSSADALVAGGFLVGAAALAPLDVELAGWIQDTVPQANQALRTGAGLARFIGYPGSLGVAGTLYAAGHLLDRPEMAAIGLHSAEAIAIAVGVTLVAKGLVGRARPVVDVTDPFDLGFGRGIWNEHYRSFPSGHTTAAFAMAAAISTELGHVEPGSQTAASIALFGAAGLVGISRMYHNEHWASDVVVGAAIGSFAGWKVVRYHRTRPDNRIDDMFLARSAAMPRLRLGLRVPL